MWRIFSSNTYVEIIEKIEKLKTVGVVFLPAPFDHSSMRTWVFSDFFFWLTTKCPHAVPKCKQLSYEYIWPTLATYNKSCYRCDEVKKKPFQQEPRGRFSVQLLRTENRHVPDWWLCMAPYRWQRWHGYFDTFNWICAGTVLAGPYLPDQGRNQNYGNAKRLTSIQVSTTALWRPTFRERITVPTDRMNSVRNQF